jgi:lysophospholipase L1-like esterase
LLLLAAAARGESRCLPPLFDGGQRLHGLDPVKLLWIDPALRQHELCWRDVPGEARIVVLGNSAIYGFPLAAEQSFSGRLNARFDAAGTAAHVFNLAWIYTYFLKDAVILDRALAYHPDVIVYALTLADTSHMAPLPFEPVIEFLRANADTVDAMAADPPPGLEEPLESVRRYFEPQRLEVLAARRVNLSTYLRLVLRQQARVIATALGAPPAPPQPKTAGRRPVDCAKVRRQDELFFRDFQVWNLLGDLAAIRARSGQRVLVVNWPVAHEPKDDCYNGRYTNARLAAFNAWLAAETTRLDLPYLDLSTMLPPGDFLDSLHVSAAGHEQIADRVAAALTPLLEQPKPQPETRPDAR